MNDIERDLRRRLKKSIRKRTELNNRVLEYQKEKQELIDYLITLENIKVLNDNLPLSLSNILVNNRRVEAARYDMLLNEIEFELSNNERWICPKCNRECYEYPALSRKDNETEICPRCGVKEAMEDFINE